MQIVRNLRVFVPGAAGYRTFSPVFWKGFQDEEKQFILSLNLMLFQEKVRVLFLKKVNWFNEQEEAKYVVRKND